MSQHVKTGRPPRNPGIQHLSKTQKPQAMSPVVMWVVVKVPETPSPPPPYIPALCPPLSLDTPGFGDSTSVAL